MNVKTIILSEEEFSNLKNANTLEQLLDFKNNIINQGSSNNIQTNNNTIVQNDIDKYIGIRILSNQEWEKYIKNGTADGSILNKDINVWHYDNTPGEYGICGGGNNVNLSNALNPDPSITTMINFVAQRVSSTMNNYYARYNININAELSSKNNNKLCNLTLIRDTLLKCYTWGNRNNSSNIIPSPLSTTLVSYQVDKNLAIIVYSAESTQKNYLGEPCFTIITANINLSFRPIFIIKDNNKSKNTYY